MLKRSMAFKSNNPAAVRGGQVINYPGTGSAASEPAVALLD